MVVEDFPPTPDVPEGTNSAAPIVALEDRLASPTDRLAAAVADLLLVTPIATLAMAPFHRMAEEAQLKGSDDQWFIATGAAVGISILIAIAYQTLFLIKWRATPGKRLFGLTVESLWQDEGAPMRPQAALLRSVAFCFEAALCGFPWIAVIGNERRRPFHDRLADTIVLSNKPSRVGPPRLAEMSLASGLVAAVFTSALIVLTMKIAQNRSSPSSTEAAAESVACDAVDHAEKTWVEGLNEKKPSRMSIALAMYESEAIDEECLKQEADASLWKTGDKDLSYLARGLAEKNDDELSQKYLDEACTGDAETDACKALAFLNDNDRPEDPVEAKTAEVTRENEVLALIRSLTPKSEPFLKVLAVRELTTRHMYSQALTLLDGFAPQKDLSFFLSSERMKTLWALNRKPEARLSLTAAVGGYDSDQRVAITRWFCQQETGERGCSTEAKASCDILASNVDHDKVLLGDPEVTLTYIRGETCAGRLDSEKLADLKNEMPDAASQKYVEALIALSKGETPKGRSDLQAIVARGEEGGAFYVEAQAKLVDLAANTKELTAIRETWMDGDSTEEGWAYLGHHMMTRYNHFQAWDQTIEIGFKLGDGEPLDPAAARAFVVAAYRSGQTKLAMGYLQTYFGPSSNASNEIRQPASLSTGDGALDDGFEQIATEIQTDMDNGIVQRKKTREPSAVKLPSRLPPKRSRR